MQRAETTKEHPSTSRTFTKRIGSTTYRVRVHFSRTSRETMTDKIMRLVKTDGRNESVEKPLQPKPASQ